MDYKIGIADILLAFPIKKEEGGQEQGDIGKGYDHTQHVDKH